MDLLKINWIRRFAGWRYFRHLFIIPTLLVFLLIIYMGIFDLQDGRRNIATVYTWTIWWSLIIFSLILAGRLWCMVCPFAALGDLAQKYISLNKRLPRRLQNMGFQTVGFVMLTWAFSIAAFDSRPMITAFVIIAILAGAVLSSIIYQRRTFCRHLCPIGAVIGIYSTVAPVELRASCMERCASHKEKDCKNACTMLESPYEMDNNLYCNFCMKCHSACPKDNLSLRLRAFGQDLYSSLHTSLSEAVASLILLGIVIVETLAMTSSWLPLKENLSAVTGFTSETLLYTVIFTLVVLLPIGIFYLACHLLKLWIGGDDSRTRDLFTQFALLFVPLGVGLHLAHNMQHLFLDAPVAVPATIRLFQPIVAGSASLINWNPAPVIGMVTIFSLQMVIIALGFGLTILVMYRLLLRYNWSFKRLYKTVIVMSTYAVVILLSSIYMLGLPMSGRHIH